MSVNRYQQKFGPDAVRRRLQGMVDPRSKVGILSRGANVYKGVTNVAQSGGGPQYGRPQGSGDVNPLQSAANRRVARKNRTPVGNRVAGSRRMMPYG